MLQPYSQMLTVRWADVDFNGHMRNTAYLDACVDVRMGYFATHGFPLSEFARQRLGPVVLRDEVDYFREMHLFDSYRLTLRVAGLSEDNSHFRLVNEFFREDGQPSARVTSTGGWLDLEARRLIAPPEALRQAMDSLVRTEEFVVLPTRGRG